MFPSHDLEADQHAIAIYKHNFKNSTYVGSVTDVRREQLPKIDVITFGSPCQDFSLAGKRRGMDGERSSLILEAIRLINECRPRVFIWENVKGTFSSNSGEDFAAILQAFTDIGAIDLNGNCVIHRGFYPKTERESTLSDILQKPQEIGEEFFLSKKMTDFLMQRQGKQMGDYKVGDLDVHEQ